MDVKKEILLVLVELRTYSKLVNLDSFNVITNERIVELLVGQFSNVNIPSAVMYPIITWDAYKDAFRTFVEEFPPSKHPNPGIDRIFSELQPFIDQIIALLKMPQERKLAIPGAKVRDILKGVLVKFKDLKRVFQIELFNPDIIASAGLTAEQVCDYILDPTIGLARNIVFNKVGKFNPVDNLKGNRNKYSLEELRVLIRYLTTPPKNETRTYHKWLDYGSGRALIRVLVKTTCPKSCIHSIFKTNGEHEPYKVQVFKDADSMACAH